MGLQHKIDNIRRQPDHVRVRYAWICAIAGTFLVVIIWGFSLYADKDEISGNVLSADQVQSIDDLKAQGSSIGSTAQSIKNSFQSVSPQKLESQQNIDDQESQADLNQSSDPNADPNIDPSADPTYDGSITPDMIPSLPQDATDNTAGEGIGNK